jgi:tetratricopeptide (TPR) repeat protein
MLRILISFLLIALFISTTKADGLDSLWNLAKSDVDTIRINAYLDLSLLYRKTNTDSSLKVLDYAEKDLLSAEGRLVQDKYNDFKARFCMQKALSLQQSDRFDSAYIYYQEALRLYTTLKFYNDKAAAYNNMGALEQRRGDYAEALKYYFKSMRLCDSADLKLVKSRTLINIGVIYNNQENYAEALKYYEQAIPLKKELGDRVGEALLYNNIGIVYYYLENYDKVLEYFKRSLNIYREEGDIRSQSRPYYNIAEIYYIQNRFKEALYYYKKSYEIDKQLGKKISQAETLSTIGVVYTNLNQYEDAIRVLKEAIRILREEESYTSLLEVISSLSFYYEHIKDYKLALKYYQQFKTISDSLQSVEKANQLDHLKLQYETEKKDREIDSLKVFKEQLTSANDKLEEQKRAQKWVYLFVIITIIFLLGGFWLFISRLKMQKQLRNRRNELPGNTDRQKKGGDLEQVISEYRQANLNQRGYLNNLVWQNENSSKLDYQVINLYKRYAIERISNIDKATSYNEQLHIEEFSLIKEGISLSELANTINQIFEYRPFASVKIDDVQIAKEQNEYILTDPQKLVFIIVSIADFMMERNIWNLKSHIILSKKDNGELELTYQNLNNTSGLLCAKGIDFTFDTALRVLKSIGGEYICLEEDSKLTYQVLIPIEDAKSVTYSFLVDGIFKFESGNEKIRVLLKEQQDVRIEDLQHLLKNYSSYVSIEALKSLPDKLKLTSIANVVYVLELTNLDSETSEFIDILGSLDLVNVKVILIVEDEMDLIGSFDNRDILTMKKSIWQYQFIQNFEKCV